MNRLTAGPSARAVYGFVVMLLLSLTCPTSKAQDVSDVALGKDGYIYITGQYWGTIDFGGDQLTAHGEEDQYLAKYSPEGTLVWARRAASSPDSSLWFRGLRVSDDGRVQLGGFYQGNMVFGGAADSSTTTCMPGTLFLAEYSAESGAFEGARCTDSRASVDSYAILADDDGYLYTMSEFYGTLSIGDTTLNSDVETGYIAKYAPDDTHEWVQTGVGGNFDGIAVDEAGNVVATGNYVCSFTAGDTTLTYTDCYKTPHKPVLAKFEASGAFAWLRDGSGGKGVVIDSSGTIFTSGESQVIDWNPLRYTDVRLAKHSPEGERLLWIEAPFDFEEPSDAGERFGDLALGPDGHVYLTGAFGWASWDTGIFVAKVSPEAAPVWTITEAAPAENPYKPIMPGRGMEPPSPSMNRAIFTSQGNSLEASRSWTVCWLASGPATSSC